MPSEYESCARLLCCGWGVASPLLRERDAQPIKSPVARMNEMTRIIHRHLTSNDAGLAILPFGMISKWEDQLLADGGQRRLIHEPTLGRSNQHVNWYLGAAQRSDAPYLDMSASEGFADRGGAGDIGLVAGGDGGTDALRYLVATKTRDWKEFLDRCVAA